MWYLKQTATNIWNASKNLVDNRLPAQKLIDSLAECNEEILPTNKLNELAAMTFQMDNFDIILQCLTTRLKTFHYDFQKSQQTYNILVTTNYLIKHGASGFVDEFRMYLGVFKKYQSLEPLKTYENQILQKKLDYNLERIKSRANHIQVLLEDKNKLLKEKQLSMLVKQKLKLYEKDKISEMQSKGEKLNHPQNKRRIQVNTDDYATKLQGIMERYVWKYVDKLDETIESASEKIMGQIDRYVIGEEPHPFEAEQINEDDKSDEKHEQVKQVKKENKPIIQTKNLLDDDDDDLMKKLSEQGEKPAENGDKKNILDFQQILNEKEEQKDAPQDLI